MLFFEYAPRLVKFTQHLWYATPDNGIAAIVYSPSEVTANVGDNVPVVISEDTYYPMDHQITFTIKEVRNKVKQVKFPFHLRVRSGASKLKYG